MQQAIDFQHIDLSVFVKNKLYKIKRENLKKYKIFLGLLYPYILLEEKWNQLIILSKVILYNYNWSILYVFVTKALVERNI